MDLDYKLDTLTASAQYDVCGYSGVRAAPKSPLRFVYRAALPDGKSVCLFKVLQTNVCTNDCGYCANQIGRDTPRTSFKPEEMAKVFMNLYQRRLVQGLFLSSGIAGSASRTMESMINTVTLLRHHYEFPGYVHLKILPGATRDYVEEACKLANRVSVNIEAPTAHHLAKLSSGKDLLKGILEPMRWVKQIAANGQGVVPSGQTTQFVVGASGETDGDILHTMEALYHEIGLRRVYFSAFQPISGTRLERVDAAPPMREHRLYQLDWLLRVYGFTPLEVELALGGQGNLSLKKDPKMMIAVKRPWLFPVDVNKASYDELLRVPGIGPVSAQRIIESRKEHSITSLQELQKMRVVTKTAAAFVRYGSMLSSEKQLSFLPELEEMITPAPSLAGIA